MAAGDRHHAVHVDRQAEIMHDREGPRPLGDAGFDRVESMFPVRGSESTKTGFAPQYSTAWAVATCDCAGTITSSPGPIPKCK